ncbi:flagellum-specific ATP synthase FliI, partial [Gammaproteobacteria bacterium]|nr:flagellum-specific ATP synthase FliI [Gammaproteobacteria bacterium]
MSVLIKNIISQIDRLPTYKEFGQVSSVLGMLVEVSGVEDVISIGDHCSIHSRNNRAVLCEVVGFKEKRALVMPFGTLEGVGVGCPVEINSVGAVIYPDPSWLGRVLNAFGEP